MRLNSKVCVCVLLVVVNMHMVPEHTCFFFKFVWMCVRVCVRACVCVCMCVHANNTRGTGIGKTIVT
jgi:hypothetical protein